MKFVLFLAVVLCFIASCTGGVCDIDSTNPLVQPLRTNSGFVSFTSPNLNDGAITTTDSSFQVWARADAAATISASGTYYLFYMGSAGPASDGLGLFYDNGVLTVAYGTTTAATTYTIAAMDEAVAHFYQVDYVAATSITVYVDGVALTPISLSSGIWTTGNTLSIGSDGVTNNWPGVIGEFRIFSTTRAVFATADSIFQSLTDKTALEHWFTFRQEFDSINDCVPQDDALNPGNALTPAGAFTLMSACEFMTGTACASGLCQLSGGSAACNVDFVGSFNDNSDAALKPTGVPTGSSLDTVTVTFVIPDTDAFTSTFEEYVVRYSDTADFSGVDVSCATVVDRFMGTADCAGITGLNAVYIKVQTSFVYPSNLVDSVVSDIIYLNVDCQAGVAKNQYAPFCQCNSGLAPTLPRGDDCGDVTACGTIPAAFNAEKYPGIIGTNAFFQNGDVVFDFQLPQVTSRKYADITFIVQRVLDANLIYPGPYWVKDIVACNDRYSAMIPIADMINGNAMDKNTISSGVEEYTTTVDFSWVDEITLPMRNTVLNRLSSNRFVFIFTVDRNLNSTKYPITVYSSPLVESEVTYLTWDGIDQFEMEITAQVQYPYTIVDTTAEEYMTTPGQASDWYSESANAAFIEKTCGTNPGDLCTIILAAAFTKQNATLCSYAGVWTFPFDFECRGGVENDLCLHVSILNDPTNLLSVNILGSPDLCIGDITAATYTFSSSLKLHSTSSDLIADGSDEKNFIEAQNIWIAFSATSLDVTLTGIDFSSLSFKIDGSSWTDATAFVTQMTTGLYDGMITNGWSTTLVFDLSPVTIPTDGSVTIEIMVNGLAKYSGMKREVHEQDTSIAASSSFVISRDNNGELHLESSASTLAAVGALASLTAAILL